MSIAEVARPLKARPSSTRGGPVQTLAGGCQHRRGHRHLTAHGLQRQARIAQGAAHIQVVAGARARAKQGLARRHLAEHREAQIQGTTRGVAAHQLAAMVVGQREQAFRKGREPGFIRLGQGQGQREGQRARAAGRQVAQVYRQAFVPESPGIGAGQEMPALHQHVRGHGQLRAGCGREQRAVIAHPQRLALRGALEEASDQIEFTHGVPIGQALSAARVGCRRRGKTPGSRLRNARRLRRCRSSGPASCRWACAGGSRWCSGRTRPV